MENQIQKELNDKKDIENYNLKKNIIKLESILKETRDKMSKITIPEDDKKKIKIFIEENIKMKLKLREIMEELRNMEANNKK